MNGQEKKCLQCVKCGDSNCIINQVHELEQSQVDFTFKMHTRFVEIAKENELLKAENEKLIKEVARLKADIAHIYKGLH